MEDSKKNELSTEQVEEISLESENIKIEDIKEIQLHIRDFLHLTKAMRLEFTVFEDRFKFEGLKTIAEWENITGLTAKK